MQPLLAASKGARSACAERLLDSTPPVIWFIRRQMRTFRDDLSVPQFRSLLWISRSPKTCLSAVAEELSASLPTASRIVSVLVRKGLVRRKNCPNDRRQVSLAITPRGRSVLNAAWRGTQSKLADALSSLDEGQVAALEQATHSLQQIFGSFGLREIEPADEIERETALS